MFQSYKQSVLQGIRGQELAQELQGVGATSSQSSLRRAPAAAMSELRGGLAEEGMLMRPEGERGWEVGMC